ncbi:FK506 binding protein proline rotamase rapamycin-binding protein [Aspergillus alliaceus]|uniref:peptidylprolyl isomerase n=1 Tax=Petromyces alliaceus TaxID=209559 RepID=A0A5N7BUX7_PETAA|nr:peptidyl-prolyl cis-trans isomerase [Aspergillus alliaceus]KAB8230869.1 peptidyl-prolyl cis-trans isomerase [Aspergillus alliaceus]KAE8385398.1 peptidyl-prolyl cis-trans isomerase [Aspergillus alliaceus]KAF5859162.1 FK506 binding protein proline rotamase rapamycin-binding protein [Aspergillus burnettii]
MGVTKQTLEPGNGVDFPQVKDNVAIHYTGWLFNPNKPENKGDQFDSSATRGPLKVAIGTGKVIQGWDEGVPQLSLGEKALLTITGDYAYGPQGFPGLIPPNATLLFEVKLISINGKSI